jgi:hypothetical protein
MRIIPICLFCASCGVYNTTFDCPPGRGIGCATVNEVMDLIVEREEGEDLFVEDPGTALLLRQRETMNLQAAHRSLKKISKLHLVKGDSGDLVLIEAQEIQ